MYRFVERGFYGGWDGSEISVLWVKNKNMTSPLNTTEQTASRPFFVLTDP